MANGVPVTYNLRISSSYIPTRHKVDFEAEVRRTLRHWYHSCQASWASGVPRTPGPEAFPPSSGSPSPFDA